MNGLSGGEAWLVGVAGAPRAVSCGALPRRVRPRTPARLTGTNSRPQPPPFERTPRFQRTERCHGSNVTSPEWKTRWSTRRCLGSLACDEACSKSGFINNASPARADRLRRHVAQHSRQSQCCEEFPADVFRVTLAAVHWSRRNRRDGSEPPRALPPRVAEGARNSLHLSWMEACIPRCSPVGQKETSHPGARSLSSSHQRSCRTRLPE